MKNKHFTARMQKRSIKIFFIKLLSLLIITSPFVILIPEKIYALNLSQIEHEVSISPTGNSGRFDIDISGFPSMHSTEIAMRLFVNGSVINFSSDNYSLSSNYFLTPQANATGICDKSEISSDKYFFNPANANLPMKYEVSEKDGFRFIKYELVDVAADPNKKFTLEVFFKYPTVCPAGTINAGKYAWVMMDDKGEYPADSLDPGNISDTLKTLGIRQLNLRNFMLGNSAMNAFAPTYPENILADEPNYCPIDSFIPPDAKKWKNEGGFCPPHSPPISEGDNIFWSTEPPIDGGLWDATKQALMQKISNVVSHAVADNFNFNVATDTSGYYLTQSGDRRLALIDQTAQNTFTLYDQLANATVTDQMVKDANIIKRHKNFIDDRSDIKYETWAELKEDLSEMKAAYNSIDDIKKDETGICMGKEGLQSEEGGINILGFIACLVNMVADQILKLAVSWMATFAGI